MFHKELLTPMPNKTWNSSNVIDDTEIGGLVYFYRYFCEYFPYVTLSLSGTVFGIIGNILIIGAVICHKELHTTTNMLIFNLALADLTISGFVDSFSVAGILILSFFLLFLFFFPNIPYLST
jgi:hypothetical protein